MNEPRDLPLYICPNCSATPLTYERDSMSCDGRLACHCGQHYPVRSGIPRFVPESNYADSFGLQWNRHRRTQLDSHSGLPISRQRLFETTGWPDRMEGQVVLEAGSGAGRFTEVLLAAGAKVVSFDYSSAVDANAANNGSHENLTLFQGDIYALPLPRRHFDKVLCIGVLQHTPTPERAFQKLTEYVKPGGELAVDIYAKRLTALLHWKYLLRPFTRRMSKDRLYRTIERMTPPLLPAASTLRRLFGRAGTRLLPITEYSHLGLGAELAMQWAVLDTFDMYAPEHDHPKTIGEVRRWFYDAGFVDTIVRRGPNGVIGLGRRPASH